MTLARNIAITFFFFNLMTSYNMAKLVCLSFIIPVHKENQLLAYILAHIIYNFS